MKSLVLIGSDNSAPAEAAREVVLRAGFDCPVHAIVSVELVGDRASQFRADLVVLFLSGSIEADLQAIRALKLVAVTHLIVIGPASDPQFILRAMQGGGDEYLDEALWHSQFPDALVRFKSRSSPIAVQRSTCRTIGVLAPSGGSGSSTVAVNVAVALSQRHDSTMLIDLRLIAGDLPAMLDVQPGFSLADLCQKIDRLDHVMFEQLFVRHSSGVCLLAAPHDHRLADQVTAAGVRRAMTLCRVRFPYVVIDLDNAYSDEQIEAIWQCDVLVLVVRLDYTSVRNTRRILDHLAELGLPIGRVRLVVNRYGESRQLAVSQAEAALGMKISHQIPDEPARIHAATNEGVPVVLHKPRARVSRSLSNLAVSLNGVHSTRG